MAETSTLVLLKVLAFALVMYTQVLPNQQTLIFQIEGVNQTQS